MVSLLPVGNGGGVDGGVVARGACGTGFSVIRGGIGLTSWLWVSRVITSEVKESVQTYLAGLRGELGQLTLSWAPRKTCRRVLASNRQT